MNFKFIKRLSLYRFAAILIIIYSALISLGGLINIVFGYYVFHSFIQYFFAELVDIEYWRLYLFGNNFLIVSTGLAGIFAGVAIWRKGEWGRRLWLGLISWLMIMSLIIVGVFQSWQPGSVSISIWCIGVLSWFVFLKRSIRDVFTYNKKSAFVPILSIVLITNIFVLVWLLKEKPQDFAQNLLSLTQMSEETLEGTLEKNIEQAMINVAKDEVLGKCFVDFNRIYELYEAKDVNGVIKEGGRLIKKKYKNDRTLLSSVAEAYYSKGDKLKAVELLEAAKNGEYLCEILKPSGDGPYHDEALIRYKLYYIYKELGVQSKSEYEYQQTVELLKVLCKEKYSEKVLENFGRSSIKYGLHHFSKDEGD